MEVGGDMDTMRALVAARDPRWLNRYQHILNRFGFVTGEVRGIKEAFERLNRVGYDAVIAEPALSDGSGLELSAHVKQQWPQVKTIYVGIQIGNLGAERKHLDAVVEKCSGPMLEDGFHYVLRQLFPAYMAGFPRSPRSK